MGYLKILDFILRLLVIPFSVAAIWITVNNRQDNTDYGKLGFNNFTGLKYMVCISGISAGYAAFGAVSSSLKWLFTQPWLFFLADQVLGYLMVSSMASQVEFMYLVYKGDRDVSWSEACGSYAHFCSRMKIAVSLHAVATSCFLFLAVISAYRLFARFQPPFLPPHNTTN